MVISLFFFDRKVYKSPRQKIRIVIEMDYKCLVVTDTGQVYKFKGDSLTRILIDLQRLKEHIERIIEEGGKTQHIIHVSITQIGV